MAAARIYNFSAGPAILPSEVFERAASAVRELKGQAHADDAPGIGLSLLEISHRGKDYMAIHQVPEQFLSALVLDGIFEDHPGLMGGCIEQGAVLHHLAAGGEKQRHQARVEVLVDHQGGHWRQYLGVLGWAVTGQVEQAFTHRDAFEERQACLIGGSAAKVGQL